jgi:exonuclease SbcC
VIERLILKDFKSHEDSDIQFNQGLNIFLGEVGAGKTSIFEAVSFALFGRYAGNINQGDLIRRGAEKAETSLTFSTHSGRYRIDRTIYPKKTQQVKMWIFDEGEWKLAVDGAMAVSKSVEDLVNVDTSTFLAAIYASQGEIKEMLETQSGKRKERLDKLLGISVYEDIWKVLGDAGNIVLTELTKSQDKASGAELLEQQFEDLKAKIKSSEKELGQLKASRKRLDKNLRPTEQQLKELDDLKERLTMVKTQIEGKLIEIQKSLKAITDLKKRRKKAEEAEKDFEKNKKFIDLEKKLEEKRRLVETVLQQKRNMEALLRRDKSDLEQALERQNRLAAQLKDLKILQEELETLEKEKKALPELEKEQVNFRERLDELKEKVVKASNEIENQKKKVNRVIELGECPTCLQTVPEEHKNRIKKETKKTITKLEAAHSTLGESRNQVQEQLEELKEKIKRAEKADRKYVETSTKVTMLTSCREELAEVEAKIKEVKATVVEKQQRIGEMKETPETLKEIDKRLKEMAAKANLARESEKLSEVKKQLDTLILEEEKNHEELSDQLSNLETSKKNLFEKYNMEEHEEAERSARSLREGRAKAMEAMIRIEKTIKDDKIQLDNMKKVLKEKREAKENVERLKIENHVIGVLRHSLRDVVQPVMRKNNVLRVSEAFQDFYQELSNDSIDYAALDEEGNIDITRNGEPSPVNSLSGGETTCAALALRLAICSSLTRNQLLLLDEPTIHLDELYRNKLRDFLGNHNFEQLVVVTHDNTFDSLPAKIFRVEKRRGRSVVSPLQAGGV